MTTDSNTTRVQNIDEVDKALFELDCALSALNDTWFDSDMSERLVGQPGTPAMNYLMGRVKAELDHVYDVVFPDGTTRTR